MKGLSLTVIPPVSSTNNYAMALVHDGKAGHGAAFTTLNQTAGKGQRGRQWHSEPGQNLAVSVVLQPELPLARQFLVSACVATAGRKFLAAHYPECAIKWPNDLYCNDRKAGGVLIENLIRGNTWLFAVAGTGINVNQVQFPDELPNPVSLRQLTGKAFNIIALANEYCSILEQQWALLPGNPGQIMAEYRQHLYKRGETVRLRKENRVFETTVLDVNNDGKLITSAIGGEYGFGEIDWVLDRPANGL